MKATLTNEFPKSGAVYFQLVEPWINRSLSGSVFCYISTPYGDVKVQKLPSGVSSLFIVKEDEGYKAYQVS